MERTERILSEYVVKEKRTQWQEELNDEEEQAEEWEKEKEEEEREEEKMEEQEQERYNPTQ